MLDVARCLASFLGGAWGSCGDFGVALNDLSPQNPPPRSHRDESSVTHHQRRRLAQVLLREALAEQLVVVERRGALRTLDRPGRHDRRWCRSRRGRLRIVTITATLMTPAHREVFDNAQPPLEAFPTPRTAPPTTQRRHNQPPLVPVMSGGHCSTCGRVSIVQLLLSGVEVTGFEPVASMLRAYPRRRGSPSVARTPC